MNGKIVTQLIAVRLGRNVASVLLPFDYVLVLITDSTGKEVQKEKILSFPCPCYEGMQGGIQVWLLSFIISVLDGGEWSTSRPGRFIHGKEAR